MTPRTAQFLALKTPQALAHWLGFSSYERLKSLFYPSPKYREFTIAKRSGATRKISAPAKLTKDVQRKILAPLTELEASRESVHGFRMGRSIVTNAKQHAYGRKTFILNIDLEDFFPSITFYRVRGVFLKAPFNLPWALSTLLAHICCHKGVLPQGAPTSPCLSNYVCRSLDGSLQKLAEGCRARYTRYADDITFSFTAKNRDVLPPSIVAPLGSPDVVGLELSAAVQKHGFKINPKKSRLQSRDHRLEVTGITVNSVPNVQRYFIDSIRGALHAWERYGLAAADANFQTRPYKRSSRTGRIPKLDMMVLGRLLYLKMVKGDADPVYAKLARKYNSLLAKSSESKARSIPVSELIVSEDDLDSAVYQIFCEDEETLQWSEGTGFFLKGIGVITCAHVVAYPTDNDPNLATGYYGVTAGKIYLRDRIGTKICSLRIAEVNDFADIAVLTPETNPEGIRQFAVSELQANKGEPVQLVGFPDHTAGKPLSVAATHITTSYSRSDIPHFDIATQIQKGNSGGPVIDQQLRVLGIAKEGQKNMLGSNQVLRLDALQLLRVKRLMTPPTTKSQPAMDTPEEPPTMPAKSKGLWESLKTSLSEIFTQR